MTVYFRNAGYRSWKCEISRAGDISNITLPNEEFVMEGLVPLFIF